MCLLLALSVLLQTSPAFAAADEPYYEAEEAVNSNYGGEYVSVYTPFDEEYVLNIQGKLIVPPKMLRLTLAANGQTIIRAFVRPDTSGKFSIQINTSAGSKEYPVALLGTVVADETGGKTGSICYDTMPGYKEVPAISDAICRLSICCAYTEDHADGVYDGNWFDSSNPLSGERGYTSTEFVLHMVNNNPQVVVYNSILGNNASVRSTYQDMSVGSYAYDTFTDPYLKDIEGYMRSGPVSRPLLQEQVDYLCEQADIVTAGASTDYEKVLRIFEFAAGNFYYDYQGYYSSPQVQYCNPYENILALRSGASGPNCINGKVATVCNGYAAVVIALCRAEGIPARMVCGYNGSGNIRVWNSIDADYWNVRNHWWAEAYVNGRWLIIDADKGSKNEWLRADGDWAVEDNACWIRGSALSYSGFDMNEELLSSNYCYAQICGKNNSQLRDPVITSVDTSSGYVTLRWNPVDGATGYYIYRGTVPEAESLGYYSSCNTTEFTSYGVSDEAGKELEEPEVTYYYRVRSVNNGTEGGWSNLFSAKVSEEEREAAEKAPVITKQPASVSAIVGQKAVFTVTAEGSNLSYRWQYYADADGGWTNTAQSGYDTDTLSVPCTLARNGYQYRCKVSNAIGAVYSEAATLTVEQIEPPIILVQPASVEVPKGETAAFTVEAEGEDLSYRWEYRPTENSEWDYTYQTGYQTTTLSVPATAARNGYQYRCQVSNNGGRATSNPATLTVKAVDAPTLLRQPADAQANPGETVRFSVVVSGYEPQYQWQYYASSADGWKNSSAASAKTATLSVTAESYRNGYKYRCKVTNSAGTVTSNAATLTVNGKPTITTQPSNKTATTGTTVTFTVGASNATGYQWQYYASSSDGWKNSSASSAKTATLSVTAEKYRNGYRYRCIVSNSLGSVTSAAATLTVKAPAAPAILAQPQSVTAAVGSTALFLIEASGSNLTYRWQFRSSSSASWKDCSGEGATAATLPIEAKSYRNGYQYRCVVSNAYSSVCSEPATLTIGQASKPIITTQPLSLSVLVGESAVFSVSATGSSLNYQWYFRTGAGAEWTKSNAAGAQTARFSVEAQSYRNGYQYRCRVSNSEGSVYSEAATLTVLSVSAPVITSQPENCTLPENETAVFSVAASGEDLSYQWFFRIGAGAEWTKSSAAGAQTARFSVEAQSYRNGYQYRCKVTNPGGSVYTNAATLTVLSVSAPVITSQPENCTLPENETAVFSVAASGEDLSYQWFFRIGAGAEWTKSSAAGAQTARFSVEAQSYRNGYQYRCKVTNPGGSVYTNAATLTVLSVAAPVITSQPASVTVEVNSSVSFTVSAEGDELQFQWYFRTGSTAEWTKCSGSDSTTPILSVEAKAYRNGYQYRCLVKNPGGSVYSAIATLAVTQS